MTAVLIVNADDLGYDPAVTRGILEAMRGGIVSSATLMVNGPHSEDAAAQAAGLALGLHLNLARWAPCWPAFPPALLSGGVLAEANAATLPAGVVEQETLAQLDWLRTLTGREATHVDVHKHLHRHPGVLEGLSAAAHARGLPVRSITPQMREALRRLGVATNEHFIGEAGAEAWWTLARLRAHLEVLPDGVTELMCHPGYAPEAVTSGYSTQRETELATFVSAEARELLRAHEVELADFTVLAPRPGP